jgi:hypothetical protein
MTILEPTDSPSEPSFTPVEFDPFAEPVLQAPFALSEAQREIWAVVQMGPEASCAYNQCFTLSLLGDVSVDTLRRAVQGVFDRHDALRTRFDARGETQVVRPPEPIDLSLVDLSGLPAEVRKERYDSILAEQVRTPLDLVQGACARACIVIEAPDCVHLVLTSHHIVFDGPSVVLFFKDLAFVYRAARNGAPAELAPATPFRNHVEFEHAPEGRRRAEVALDYWKAQFADGAPSLELPTDRARPVFKTYRGGRERVVLAGVSSVDVTRAAGRLGATPVVLLLAAFQALLHRLSGQTDVVVGLPVSVRNPSGGDALMGHAINLLPMRARINPRATFAELVRHTRSTLLDGHEHQSLTFGTLVQVLRLPRDTSRTPLVAALFNFGSEIAPEFPDCSAEIGMAPRHFVNFELELQVASARSELSLDLAYNADLFDAATMCRWLGHYEELLAAGLANPETRLDRLPLLRDSDREALDEWNRMDREYPR